MRKGEIREGVIYGVRHNGVTVQVTCKEQRIPSPGKNYTALRYRCTEVATKKALPHLKQAANIFELSPYEQLVNALVAWDKRTIGDARDVAIKVGYGLTPIEDYWPDNVRELAAKHRTDMTRIEVAS